MEFDSFIKKYIIKEVDTKYASEDAKAAPGTPHRGIKKISSIIVQMAATPVEYVLKIGFPLPIKSVEITLLILNATTPGNNNHKGRILSVNFDVNTSSIAGPAISANMIADGTLQINICLQTSRVNLSARSLPEVAVTGKSTVEAALDTHYASSVECPRSSEEERPR